MGFIRISTLMLTFVSLRTFVIGEDKHMICKTVDDLFTVDGGGRSHHSPITTRRLQGAPGKLGPPGIKGDVGPPGPRGGKGSPGADNNGRIDQVEVRLTARIEEIERRFQEKISQLNDTVAKIPSVKENLCNGVFYQGLCYFAIIHASKDMKYNEAVEICRAKSSKPADILDSTHYNMIFEYVRSLTSSPYRYLWLGTTISPLTKVVSLSNGNRASYVKYRSSYPYSSSTWIQMAIKVDQDTSSTSQGMFNYIPTYDLHGVLCQK